MIAATTNIFKPVLMASLPPINPPLSAFVNWKWKDLSIEYYNSETYKNFLATKPSIKPDDYPKYIASATTELSVFKAVTGKLFILFFFSISVSFISAVFLRKAK